MSLMSNFSIAGTAMASQSQRLNMIASNVANANTTAGSKEEAYRSRQPVFESILMDQRTGAKGVMMSAVVESDAEPVARYEPNNPLSDEEGYVWGSNVNMVEEMANMIASSRNYQSNVKVVETSRQLMLRTLSLGE